MPSDFLIDQQAVEGDLRGRNLELMLAFTVHKRALCPHCGYPREVCRNEERFKAQEEFCYAKAAVDEAGEEAQKAPGGAEHGLLHVPVYQPPVEI